MTAEATATEHGETTVPSVTMLCVSRARELSWKSVERCFRSPPHWRVWMKPENRCLFPFGSFAEYAPEANPARLRWKWKIEG